MATKKNFAELHIQDFKAIKRADINLNGITVISGINGCGKSTMSTLVKDIYGCWGHYNFFERDIINNRLKGYDALLKNIGVYIGADLLFLSVA